MNDSSARPRSNRRIVVLLVALLGSPLLAEVALRRFGSRYDPAEAEREVRRILEVALGDEGGVVAQALEEQDDEAPQSAAEIAKTHGHILHPYFGYDNLLGVELFERHVATHQRDDGFTILIFGGSVAEIFTGTQRGGMQHLKEFLKADARFADTPIQPCRMARAGFKQPQELIELAYFLARGCVPDVVISIDGLNSIKLGPRNLLAGVPPTWPEANHWLHQTGFEQVSAASLDLLLDARALQRRLIDSCRANLGSGALKLALLGRGRLEALYALRDEWATQQASYLATLARERLQPVSAEELLQAMVESADCWMESTRLMHNLCQSVGSSFYCFLQPTLHDLGSKPISQQERETCLPEEGVDPNIKLGYDMLRERGAKLRGEGIRFVDTSYLFEDIEETLYYDRAHFALRGNKLLAERIAEVLLTEP